MAKCPNQKKIWLGCWGLLIPSPLIEINIKLDMALWIIVPPFWDALERNVLIVTWPQGVSGDGRGGGIVPLPPTLDCRRDDGRLRFILGWDENPESDESRRGSRRMSERSVVAGLASMGGRCSRLHPGRRTGGLVAVAVDVVVVLSGVLLTLPPPKIAAVACVCGGIGARASAATDAAATLWAPRPKPLWTNEDTGSAIHVMTLPIIS